MKATLERAVEDQKLANNPAAKVRVRSSSRILTRSKGYTDAEAKAVLLAARQYRPVVRDNSKISESAHIAAAKRWGPWLCAFTGARVTEIMQLRRTDVLHEDGIDFIRITPDAGSVKSRAYRDVPLHPQLIEEGSTAFVASLDREPLFYSPAADVSKRPAETSSGEYHLGQLVRALAQHGDLDPVMVVATGSGLTVLDRFHRVETYRRAKRTEVPVVVLDGTAREAVLEAARRNTKAVLTMSNGQRQNLAWQLVNAAFTLNELTRATGISRAQVSIMRRIKKVLGDDAAEEETWHSAMRRATEQDSALSNASGDVRRVCCSDRLSPPPEADVGGVGLAPKVVIRQGRHSDGLNGASEDAPFFR